MTLNGRFQYFRIDLRSAYVLMSQHPSYIFDGHIMGEGKRGK